jgi:hypothetical protein
MPGFRLYSELSLSVRITDFAAVNVNMWLTPDEANKGGGGLVVYDVVRCQIKCDWP